MKLAQELGKSGLDYESICNDNDIKQVQCPLSCKHPYNKQLFDWMSLFASTKVGSLI